MPLKSVFFAAKFYYMLQRALVHIHYLTWWRAHKHHSIRFYLRAAKNYKLVVIK